LNVRYRRNLSFTIHHGFGEGRLTTQLSQSHGDLEGVLWAQLLPNDYPAGIGWNAPEPAVRPLS